MSYNNHVRMRFWYRGWGIFWRVILGIIGAVVLAFLFGYFIQLLWNWIMPVIFNLGKISYWQGFGIALLARLVFGSFGHNWGHHGYRRHHFHRYPGHEYWEGDRDWGWESDWQPKGGWREWKYYKDYWKEEGKAAFEKYLEKRREDQNKPKQDQ